MCCGRARRLSGLPAAVRAPTRRTMTTLTDLGSGLGVYRGQRITEQARNSSERWTKAALSPSKLAATIALTLVIRSAGGIAWAVTGGRRA